MLFPDFPIGNISDFERWYGGVIENVQWNAHELSNLKVSGDEKKGFSVSVDVGWKARTYKGEKINMAVHQDWEVSVGGEGKFIITKHRATVK